MIALMLMMNVVIGLVAGGMFIALVHELISDWKWMSLAAKAVVIIIIVTVFSGVSVCYRNMWIITIEEMKNSHVTCSV
jgi:hypothetical protein